MKLIIAENLKDIRKNNKVFEKNLKKAVFYLILFFKYAKIRRFN